MMLNETNVSELTKLIDSALIVATNTSKEKLDKSDELIKQSRINVKESLEKDMDNLYKLIDIGVENIVHKYIDSVEEIKSNTTNNINLELVPDIVSGIERNILNDSELKSHADFLKAIITDVVSLSIDNVRNDRNELKSLDATFVDTMQREIQKLRDSLRKKYETLSHIDDLEDTFTIAKYIINSNGNYITHAQLEDEEFRKGILKEVLMEVKQ